MNGKPWTALEVDLLRRWWTDGTSMPVLVAALGHSASSVKQKARHLRLQRPDERYRWTPAAEQLLRERYADTPSAEIAQQLGCRLVAVHRKAAKLGLAKSRECIQQMARERMTPDHPARKTGFKPGTKPWNTGKKITLPEECRATQFKKGQRPHTWVPLGTYRINGDGCLEVKYSEDPGPPTRRWRPVHRQVWMDAYGPVPAGHMVVFKPGRWTNVREEISLDAIECITFKENMARNTIHARLPPELRKVVQLRGVLTRVINRRTREEQAT